MKNAPLMAGIVFAGIAMAAIGVKRFTERKDPQPPPEAQRACIEFCAGKKVRGIVRVGPHLACLCGKQGAEEVIE